MQNILENPYFFQDLVPYLNYRDLLLLLQVCNKNHIKKEFYKHIQIRFGTEIEADSNLEIIHQVLDFYDDWMQQHLLYEEFCRHCSKVTFATGDFSIHSSSYDCNRNECNLNSCKLCGSWICNIRCSFWCYGCSKYYCRICTSEYACQYAIMIKGPSTLSCPLTGDGTCTKCIERQVNRCTECKGFLMDICSYCLDFYPNDFICTCDSSLSLLKKGT